MTQNRPRDSRGDLTEGNIARKLISFSLPMIAGNLISQLYNVVDSIVVGNFVGSDALAAVSASFPIMMLFNAMFWGIAVGAGIVIAQNFGAKRYDVLNKAVNTAFTLVYASGILISIIGTLFSGPLLKLLGTPENIIGDSTVYLAIIFAGTLGNMAYNIGGGILRGMGDSRWPLVFLSVSAVLNIVLDLLFVIVFKWGVAGVAIATILSHIVSGALVHIRINSGVYPVHVSPKSMRIEKQLAATIIRLGVPAAIQNVAMSLGSVIIQSFANKFGSNYIAANSIVQKVDGFAIVPMMAFGMALSTFVGQNVGAGRHDRAKEGIHVAMTSITVFGLILGVFLWFFGHPLMRVFTDNQTVLDIGFVGIRILAFFYFIMGMNQNLAGAMRGAGASVAPMITSIAGSLVRIPVAYFIAVVPNNMYGLFWSMVASIVIQFILLYSYFRSGHWQNFSVVKPREASLATQ
jgi:putative MATE family efflux protein